jgi:hypothetical protein
LRRTQARPVVPSAPCAHPSADDPQLTVRRVTGQSARQTRGRWVVADFVQEPGRGQIGPGRARVSRIAMPRATMERRKGKLTGHKAADRTVTISKMDGVESSRTITDVFPRVPDGDDGEETGMAERQRRCVAVRIDRFAKRSRSQLTGRTLLNCPGRRTRGLCRAVPDAQL